MYRDHTLENPERSEERKEATANWIERERRVCCSSPSSSQAQHRPQPPAHRHGAQRGLLARACSCACSARLAHAACSRAPGAHCTEAAADAAAHARVGGGSGGGCGCGCGGNDGGGGGGYGGGVGGEAGDHGGFGGVAAAAARVAVVEAARGGEGGVGEAAEAAQRRHERRRRWRRRRQQRRRRRTRTVQDCPLRELKRGPTNPPPERWCDMGPLCGEHAHECSAHAGWNESLCARTCAVAMLCPADAARCGRAPRGAGRRSFKRTGSFKDSYD